MTDTELLKSRIVGVRDFPKPGVSFKDITPLLQDPRAFREAVRGLISYFYGSNPPIDKVVGLDARGFLFAAPVALALNAGLVITRKKGKLPRETVSFEYDLEYDSHVLEMHRDAIRPGERVAIVDDVLATGGTLQATVKLVQRLGGVVSGIVVLAELEFLNGRSKLNCPVHALVSYKD